MEKDNFFRYFSHRGVNNVDSYNLWRELTNGKTCKIK